MQERIVAVWYVVFRVVVVLAADVGSWLVIGIRATAEVNAHDGGKVAKDDLEHG